MSNGENVNNKYQTLDGMRGMAAIIVVIWHTPLFFGFRPGSGYLAVDLFFCLSGFVLAHSYSDKLIKNKITWKEFILLRVIRLYPLYLLGMLVMVGSLVGAIALHWRTNWTLIEIGKSVLFSLAFLPTPPLHSDAVFPLNNPSWSLFFELLVNMIYGLFVFNGSIRQLRWIVLISSVLLGVTLFINGDLDNGGNWSTFVMAVPRAFYSFFVGVYIYRKKLTIKLNSVIIISLCGIFLWIDPGQLRTFYDIICVLIIFPLLVLAGSANEPNRFTGKIFLLLGSVSYALYVLHIPIAAIIEGFNKKFPGYLQAPELGFLTLSLLILLCVVADIFYDAPLRRYIGSKLAKRRYGAAQPIRD